MPSSSGAHKADDLEYLAIVESSPFARRLHEKNDFVWLRDVAIRVPSAAYEGERPPGGFSTLVDGKA